MLSGPFPVLDNVIVWGKLPPTVTFPNATLVGLTVICGCVWVPVPESEIDRVGFDALLVTVTLPDTAPAEPGAYFVDSVAVCPAVSVTGTVIPLDEKPVPPVAIWEMVMLVVPALVSTMFCELLLPTFTFPKAMLDGFALNTEAVETPVPAKAIDCGELTALLVAPTLPIEAPALVGANVAVKGIDWPALTVIGAVIPVIEYPAPATERVLIVSGAVPLLEIVTVCEALPPTDTFPKLREFGAYEICACPPVPLNGTVVGEDGSSLVTVSEPEIAPED
jgi:hypothetical protein